MMGCRPSAVGPASDVGGPVVVAVDTGQRRGVGAEVAAVGVPGFANFVGEFKSLVGSYIAHPTLTIVAAIGIIFSATGNSHSMRCIAKQKAS